MWSLTFRPWLVLLIDQASGQILICRMDLKMDLEGQEALDRRGLLYRLCLRVVLALNPPDCSTAIKSALLMLFSEAMFVILISLILSSRI